MISRLTLERFKAFEGFTVPFSESAVIVGPNNAGKSTIITALKSAGLMLESASRVRASEPRIWRRDRVSGHPFSADRFNLEDENVRHEFRNLEATFEVTFSKAWTLRAVWPKDDPENPYFFLRTRDGVVIESPVTVRAQLPSVGVVPSLTPLEQRERLLDDRYVRQSTGGRLSSRHFRNQLRLAATDNRPLLEGFYDYVTEWLPEISLEWPETHHELSESRVDVYYREGRGPKELAWAGDGLQVYLQILWHLYLLASKDTIILDEPEVYLHPDLQRRLVRALEASPKQFILATHSPEIVAEVAQESLIWIDKTAKRAKRATDASALLTMSTGIGSAFNLGLARVLRTKLALFVEGDDMRIIRNLAGAVRASAIHKEDHVAVVPLGGVTRLQALEGFAWLASEFLGETVRGFVLLDRDYRSLDECKRWAEQVAQWGMGVHVWKRHEIENYLVAPSAIARLTGASVETVEAYLDQACDGLRDAVLAGLTNQRAHELKSKGIAVSTIVGTCQEEIRAVWSNRAARLALCPGKETLAALNRQLQSNGRKAVSPRSISAALQESEVPLEMQRVLADLEALRG